MEDPTKTTISKFTSIISLYQLEKSEIVPVGLYQHRPKKWGDYITGNTFNWTSKIFFLEDVAIEIELEAWLESPIENFIVGEYVEVSSIKPQPEFRSRKVAVEIIPKTEMKPGWDKFRSPEKPVDIIDTLVVEHVLEAGFDLRGDGYKIPDKIEYSICRRPGAYKNPKEWERIKEFYEKMNRERRPLYRQMFGERLAKLHEASPPLPRGWWRSEYEEVFQFDEEKFKEFMRNIIPRLRLGRSYLSKKLPGVLFEEEKSLFIDLLYKAVEVYGLPEQSIAHAVASAQDPVDFDIGAEDAQAEDTQAEDIHTEKSKGIITAIKRRFNKSISIKKSI